MKVAKVVKAVQLSANGAKSPVKRAKRAATFLLEIGQENESGVRLSKRSKFRPQCE